MTSLIRPKLLAGCALLVLALAGLSQYLGSANAEDRARPASASTSRA